MNERSDRIALTNLGNNNIFVIRRNSARGNDVSHNFPSLCTQPLGSIPQLTVAATTEKCLSCPVPDCYHMITCWISEKCQNLSHASLNETTVEEVGTFTNSDNDFVVNPNSSMDNVRPCTSSERGPPSTGRQELMFDEEGGSRKNDSSCFYRVSDWLNRKWCDVGSKSTTSDCVIELTPMDTENIFEVRRNVCNCENTHRLACSVHGGDRVQPLESDPTSNKCFQQLLGSCRRSGSYLVAKYEAMAAHLDYTFDWSVLHAWNIVAYISCSAPKRLELDRSGNYAIKSHFLQKIAWTIQMIFVFAGIVRGFAFFARESRLDKPDPFEYIKLGRTVATTLTAFVFMKVVAFSNNLILDVHQNFTYNNNHNLPQLNSKKMGLIALISFCCFIFFMLSIQTFTFAYDFYGTLHLSSATLLQAFACYSRQTYAWYKIDECGEDAFIHLLDVPSIDILLGLLGFLTFISENLFKLNMTLAIFACSLTLALQAWNAIGDEAYATVGVYQLTAKHTLLTDLSKDISRYIGGTLILQMTSVAFTLSLVLKMVFVESSAEFITLILSVVTNLLSFLISSTGAMLIDEIEDEFTNPNNLNHLPNNAVAAVAFLLKLFKTNVGIGYRGLFVLNFRFLVGYIGIIGTLTKILYEATKDSLGT